MHIEQLKDKSHEAESLLKSLANANRLMILCHLIKQSMRVSDLVNALDLSQSAISQHLGRLKQENIISARSDGKQTWYAIDSAEVSALMALIQLIYCKEV